MTQASKSAHLLGQKIGMTRVYSEDGTSLPVTVIKVEPNTVTQIRTPETDGYSAVQVGAGEIKARNSTMPLIGHDAKAGVAPRRKHVEFRVEDGTESNWELGQTLSVSELDSVKFVDVIGTSKGKGFQGGMKRWGFKGQLASHGVERKHRSPGSIGGHGNNAGKSGRIKKGKKMSGHQGNARVTVRSLDVVRVDAEKNLLLVKGPVPGHNNAWVEIRPATRLYRSKASKA
ncbi:MAG: 50S ribosomal protein L3 [Phycisphaerales bacterium JB052]